MLFRTSRIVIATLAVVTLGATPALAMPIDPTSPADARGEQAASLSGVSGARGDQVVSPSGVADARGEQAASLSATGAASLSATAPSQSVTELRDLRTEIAREPLQPVVVEVDEPVVSGFDWGAAAIGAAGGLALVLIAGAAVMFARHRPARTLAS
jgi:hypothetical protein